jgi:hypothetical protein
MEAFNDDDDDYYYYLSNIFMKYNWLNFNQH